MVGRVATVANQALVLRNWIVGAYIVEFEQNGKDRAKYGARLLERLAGDLKAKGIRGLTVAVLRLCRLAYFTYPQIRQTLSIELAEAGRVMISEMSYTESKSSDFIPETLSKETRRANRQTLSAESPAVIRGQVVPELPPPLSAEELLRFSWSQLQEFIRLDDPWKRAFYENECLRGHWSVRQLQRQIESLLYERTGLSTNKKAVVERARKQEPQETITDVLRDPYILEFAGLAELPVYSVASRWSRPGDVVCH